MNHHSAPEPEPDHVHGRRAATPRLTAGDFDPAVLSLFDRYVHGLIDRRGFLDGAARCTGVAGVAGAAALLTALSPVFRKRAAGVAVRPAHHR